MFIGVRWSRVHPPFLLVFSLASFHTSKSRKNGYQAQSVEALRQGSKALGLWRAVHPCLTCRGKALEALLPFWRQTEDSCPWQVPRSQPCRSQKKAWRSTGSEWVLPLAPPLPLFSISINKKELRPHCTTLFSIPFRMPQALTEQYRHITVGFLYHVPASSAVPHKWNPYPQAC